VRILILIVSFLFAFDSPIDKLFYQTPFEIVKAYGEFDFIGGFADGKYKLVNYTITPIKNNIYETKLYFQKKKGVFRYNQNITIYAKVKKNEIIFANKYSIAYVKKLFELKKYKNYYIYTPATQKIALKNENGKIILFIKFN
jgi:hypothetical protein